jgi:DNA-binding transcriptional MerR regulator
MRIGEIASRAGVSRDTVRFYERMGLLSEASQPHLSNNYKEYSPVALRRIERRVGAGRARAQQETTAHPREDS